MALVASRLPRWAIVCIKDAGLSADTCHLLSGAAVKLEKMHQKPEMENVYFKSTGCAWWIVQIVCIYRQVSIFHAI